MSKADAKREKQHKRQLENLERGLRRGSVELTLDALVELPAADLSETQDRRVRALLVPKLEAALRGRDSASLKLWLRALGREPKLLERLGAVDHETVWALLWTALGAHSYELSAQLWGVIHEQVRAQAPLGAAAIEALLTTRGHPDPSLVPVLRSGGDPRLGIEPVRSLRATAAVPFPADPADAEPRLIELRAAESWSTFALTAQQWLVRAPAPSVAPLCATVAELALLELVDSREHEAASLVLAADRRLREVAQSSPTERSGEQVRLDRALAFAARVAFARLWSPEGERRRGDWIVAALRQSVRLPELGQSIILALSHAPSAVLVPVTQLLQELHARAPTPALWLRSALSLDLACEERVARGHSASESDWRWVGLNLQPHLARPRELNSAISALASADFHRLYEMLEELLEPEQAADLIAALWEGAPDHQRGPMIELATAAISEAAGAEFCEECGVYHAFHGDLGASAAALTPRAERLFARLEPLLLAHGEYFLELSLGRAQRRPEQRAILDRYLAPGVPIDNYLHALQHARRLGLPAKPYRERLKAVFSGQLSAFERGFELAMQRFGPRSAVCKELAGLFVVAAEQGRAEALSSDSRKSLLFARKLAQRRVDKASKQLMLPLSAAR